MSVSSAVIARSDLVGSRAKSELLLGPIGGALPESSQSKGPMWREAHGVTGGKRHVLSLQSSFQEAIQEDTEVGAILGPASFWKGSWRCICEGAARLLLILDS